MIRFGDSLLCHNDLSVDVPALLGGHLTAHSVGDLLAHLAGHLGAHLLRLLGALRPGHLAGHSVALLLGLLDALLAGNRLALLPLHPITLLARNSPETRRHRLSVRTCDINNMVNIVLLIP